jgi:ribosomal protein L7Ae-like RNA K-turn-binding protein
MQDDLLKTLGLMRRAGKLSAGEDGVRQAVRKRSARLILVAADASENAVKRAEGFADAAQVPLIRLDADKDTLCRALGVNGGAMFAVCDEGFKQLFLKKQRESQT